MNPDYDFHFYRCDSCKSLVTYDDEQEALKVGQLQCCGGAKYKPTNPTDVEWETEHVKAYCEAHELQRDPAECK